MLRGVYAAASAMMAETTKQDTIANNIANAGTPGFKRDMARFESFRSVLLQASDQPYGSIGELSYGSLVQSTHVDMTRGTIQTTGNPLDVTVVGDGFLVVETPEGKAYTREGALIRGDGKHLSTGKGHALLSGGSFGSGGKILIDGNNVIIGRDGTVTANGTTVGKLQVVRFENPAALQKDAYGYFLAGEQAPQTVAAPEIESGSLEFSNVNPVKEMVSLITVLRSYEASTKALGAQDETLSKAVNEIAR